ncbi:MAG: hypothetical protein JO360_04200 [Acidobacteria bacterium]|nr:hypothetical protein [Acidobacteriota bacterium]
MVLLPDGKILVGGETTNSQSDKFALMRLNSDGTLDTSFGSGGIVLTTVNLSAHGSRLLVQPDGKILLGGYSYRIDTDYDFTIIRYTADGALDTSFNNTGSVTQTFGSSVDEGYDMGLQPDGKILLVGRTWQIQGMPGVQWDIGVMRFNTDGSLDTTFNGTGKLIFGTASDMEEAHSVLIQPDGKILIGGLQKTTKNDFLLLRLNSNGTLDTSFGSGGSTITTVSPGDNIITSLALQSNGKILAGGFGYIARYTPDGVLDPSFGVGGTASTSAENQEIRVIGGDKFLVAMKFGANAGVVRYMENGAPDTNFNGGGAANIFTQGSSCIAYSVALQPDNKILLGGVCSQDVPKFAVFRLQETRTKRFLDFSGDGLTDVSIFRPSNGQWWYSSNIANEIFAGQWGLSTDRPVPADFTGDGRTDVAVFRPSTGEWFILRSDDGTSYSFTFGTAGDIPIVADFDGDDKADAGVFRPSTNEWYIQKSTGGLMAATFGAPGDKPVPSDYDGDFKTDIAIYRPSTGEWWINQSSDGSIHGFSFGTSTDLPVQGDYTGDNKTDAAVYRPSTGEWFILPSEGGPFFGVHFGTDGDLPTPGNYGGDGRYDLVVYRPSENRWYFQVTGGPFSARYFGATGDQPLPNLFVP